MNRLQELLALGLENLNEAQFDEVQTLMADVITSRATIDPAALDDDALAELEGLAASAEAIAEQVGVREGRVQRRQNAPAMLAAAAAALSGGTPTPVPLSQVARRMQARRPDREPMFHGETGAVLASLTASSDVTVPVGADLSDPEELARVFNDRIASLGNRDGQAVALQSRYRLPQQISRGGNSDVITQDLDEAATTALVASGGVCRPVSIDYQVPIWTNAERPIKAALPAADAPRGGLTYTIPPVFSQGVYGAGVAIWSEANDRNPGGSNTGPNSNPTGTGPVTKPCLSIDCDQTMTTYVEAITACIQISNFRGRFSPENITAAMAYLEQAWTSVAEIELLTQMRGYSKHITYPQQYGVSRDVMVALDRIQAYYRSRYRLSDNVTLRMVLQSWVKNAIRSDIAKAAFGGQGDANAFAISDEQISSWFGVRNISPVWALDDDTADQTFASMSAGTPGSPVTLSAYPAFFRAMVYPEGTFVRLDGGELNLGVVRDSALNAVNQYQVFSESFESVAMRGFESLDVKVPFAVNGSSAGTITPA